jgi:hypothetical protein
MTNFEPSGEINKLAATAPNWPLPAPLGMKCASLAQGLDKLDFMLYAI